MAGRRTPEEIQGILHQPNHLAPTGPIRVPLGALGALGDDYNCHFSNEPRQISTRRRPRLRADRSLRAAFAASSMGDRHLPLRFLSDSASSRHPRRRSASDAFL